MQGSSSCLEQDQRALKGFTAHLSTEGHRLHLLPAQPAASASSLGRETIGVSQALGYSTLVFQVASKQSPNPRTVAWLVPQNGTAVAANAFIICFLQDDCSHKKGRGRHD